MTQNEKNLLLKDLCGRLPYGVKVWFPDWSSGYISSIESIDIDGYITDFEGTTWEISDCKPYLFPMSSMTAEQEMECQQIKHSYYYDDDSFVLFDWYDKNHIDYRGLIPMGSALDATGKNIY